jgi:hypothetical protein
MDQNRHHLIVHKRVQRIADDHNCTVAEVNAALDQHPIEVDRDRYLKRALAMQLLMLDQLENAFHSKAVEDRDTAAGMLLVKVCERKATLLGLNPPLGHAVAVIQPEPADTPTSTERIRAAIDRIQGKRLPKPEPPDDPEPPQPH